MQPVEALEQGGHWAEALALQKRLRQSGSGIDASYLHQLGRLYQRCHLDSQSERAYRLALDLDPARIETCLLYTSPSPRDLSTSRMPSSA